MNRKLEILERWVGVGGHTSKFSMEEDESGPIVRFHMMSWQFNICLQNNETVSILVYQENPVFQLLGVKENKTLVPQRVMNGYVLLKEPKKERTQLSSSEEPAI